METGIHNTSEIGRLKKVLLHRPGGELENLMPEYLERLLFDDIPYLKEAQREHDAFADCLRQQGVEVVYLRDLVAESITDADVRADLIRQFLEESGVKDDRLRESLEDFLSALPDKEMVSAMMAGVRKSQLRANSARLGDYLSAAGDDYPFAVDPLPNLYFTRDPFATIGTGVSIHKMHTATRNRETLFGKFIFEHHPDYRNAPRWYDRGETSSLEGTTLKVGASPAPHAEILAVVKELLAEEGINLEIVEFTDYIQPNTAVENGSIDANYFQHITYLNNFNAENGTHLVSVADVHYEPFGIYAGKTASLEELQDGAQIGVPNDPTNGGRALLLLQEQGLITLKEDVGLEPTKLDIAENPHNYEIVEMEAAQLPRSLGSLDIAVINGNYAIQADLKVADALAIESAEGTAGTAYVNVLAVKEGRESDPAIQALAKALCSDEVKAFIDETYAGAVQAVF